MRTTVRIMVLTLVASGGAVAWAQVQPPQDRINTALARARQVGIPVALLESKIAEGKAKGVSLERIAAAVERRQAALEHASQALAGHQGVRNADLSVAADAVESGVSAGVIRTLSGTAPQGRRAAAIAALAQLVELGHGSEAALARVRDALARGPDALVNLPAQAAANGRRGGGPPETPPGAARGRGQAGPPAGVPAPGSPTQPTRPGGPPADRGRPADTGGARGAGAGD